MFTKHYISTQKNSNVASSNNCYTPQFLLQVFPPLALAEATEARVE